MSVIGNIGKGALGTVAGLGGAFTKIPAQMAAAKGAGGTAMKVGLGAAAGSQLLASSAQQGRQFLAERAGMPLAKDRNVSRNMMKQSSRSQNGPSIRQKLDKSASATQSQFRSSLEKGLGTAAAGVLAASAIGGSIYGAKKLYSKMRAEDNWKEVLRRNPSLNTNKDRENYQVLLEYAPDLTKNPKVAASYLIRAREQHLMPHEFIKDLVSITKDRESLGYGGRLLGKTFK